MAGRRTKKLKSSAETTRDNRRVLWKPGAIYRESRRLPREMLELIFSQLSLGDNIRVSAVCRSWQAAAISVRKADKPPLLMSRPKSGNFYEFYDPSQRKMYYLELPKLRGSRILYSKDSWLLLYKPRTQRIFFFCPYTRDLIKMPKLYLADHTVAFSAPPTSPSCILLTVMRINPEIFAVRMCRPGAIEWTSIYYQHQVPFVRSIWNKIVFRKDLFYCLDLSGWLGIFDPENRTWSFPVKPPIWTEYSPAETWCKGQFMAEHNGDIFVVYTCTWKQDPFIYMLDQTNTAWLAVSSLGDVTLFTDSLSSHARTNLLGNTRGHVYFSKVLFYGKRCITYSLDDDRYYPRREFYDWKNEEPFDKVWIEAPEDLSAFLTGGS